MKTSSPGVIPAGMVLRGSIEGEGDLIVAGRIEGEIHLQGSLQLEAGGSLQAEVRVRRAVIGGSIEGNLWASEVVELLGASRIEGDLRAPRLIIADGAIVRGRVELGGGGESAGTAAAETGPAEAEEAKPEIVAKAASDAGRESEVADPKVEERLAGSEGKPPLPPSALTFGDRRKRIVSSSEE